jgi:hypothetical protein
VPLTFDACTSLGLLVYFYFSGLVDPSGIANAPTIPFFSIGSGVTIYSAAITIDFSTGMFGPITDPISYVTQ